MIFGVFEFWQENRGAQHFIPLYDVLLSCYKLWSFLSKKELHTKMLHWDYSAMKQHWDTLLPTLDFSHGNFHTSGRRSSLPKWVSLSLETGKLKALSVTAWELAASLLFIVLIADISQCPEKILSPVYNLLSAGVFPLDNLAHLFAQDWDVLPHPDSWAYCVSFGTVCRCCSKLLHGTVPAQISFDFNYERLNLFTW